jgi:hypothetical protein
MREKRAYSEASAHQGSGLEYEPVRRSLLLPLCYRAGPNSSLRACVRAACANALGSTG